MGDLLLFVNLVCFTVALMIVWFKSAAFVEYSKLLGLNFLLLGYEQDPNNLSFPQYLYVKSRTLFRCSICKFLITLITCPLCLGAWLSIGAACFYGNVLITPMFYMAVLLGYFLMDRIIG